MMNSLHFFVGTIPIISIISVASLIKTFAPQYYYYHYCQNGFRYGDMSFHLLVVCLRSSREGGIGGAQHLQALW